MPLKIISREEAKEVDRKYYFTGESCEVCHTLCRRNTETGECLYCAKVERARIAKNESRRKMSASRPKPPRVVCPCGGETACRGSHLMANGDRRGYYSCKICDRTWMARNGVIEKQSAFEDPALKDGRGGKRIKPTIPGARVILGRCMSGSD